MRAWDCLVNYVALNLPKVKLANGRWYWLDDEVFRDCETDEVFKEEPHIRELRFPISESLTISGGSNAGGG